MTYANVGRKEFEAAISPYLGLDDLEVVMTAYALSKGAHRGETRADGVTRYFEHPKSVTWILIEAGVHDRDTLVIALLHDVLEDTFLLTPKRIEINFGIGVRQGVQDVTIVPDPKETHQEYMERLLGPLTDWRTLLVKLADRLHNLRTLEAVAPEKRERKLAETRELYLPVFGEILGRMPTPSLKVIARTLCREITALCEA